MTAPQFGQKVCPSCDGTMTKWGTRCEMCKGTGWYPPTGEQADDGRTAPPGRFDVGMDQSEAAGRKWSEEEVAAVDAAILRCARTLLTFTTDDVWAVLGDGFRVTKGMAGRLNAAAGKGIIEATTRTTKSQRTNTHGHGQRLTIWRSLLYD